LRPWIRGYVSRWGKGEKEVDTPVIVEFSGKHGHTVCPFARNNSAPTRHVFMKFGISEFFENLSRKLQVSLKPDKNNEYFT
jgi:hypothetical protein